MAAKLLSANLSNSVLNGLSGLHVTSTTLNKSIPSETLCDQAVHGMQVSSNAYCSLLLRTLL